MTSGLQLQLPIGQVTQTLQKNSNVGGTKGLNENETGLDFGALLGEMMAQSIAPGEEEQSNEGAMLMAAQGLFPELLNHPNVFQQAVGQELGINLVDKTINPKSLELTVAMPDSSQPELEPKVKADSSAEHFNEALLKNLSQPVQQELASSTKQIEMPAAELAGDQLAKLEVHSATAKSLETPAPDMEADSIKDMQMLDTAKGQDFGQSNQQNLNFSSQVEKAMLNAGSTKPAMEQSSFQPIADQLVQFSKTSISKGKSEVEIQLKPEYLGKVHLRLALEEGILTAKFMVESHAVGKLLENNLGQLRQSLQEQGLKFDQVQVDVGMGNFQEGQAQQQFNQSEKRFVGPFEKIDSTQEDSETSALNLNGVNYLA